MFVGCEDEKNRLETDAFFIQQDNDGWHSIALLVSLLWQLSKIQFVWLLLSIRFGLSHT